jgi:hypothetical protein
MTTTSSRETWTSADGGYDRGDHANVINYRSRCLPPHRVSRHQNSQAYSPGIVTMPSGAINDGDFTWNLTYSTMAPTVCARLSRKRVENEKRKTHQGGVWTETWGDPWVPTGPCGRIFYRRRGWASHNVNKAQEGCEKAVNVHERVMVIDNDYSNYCPGRPTNTIPSSSSVSVPFSLPSVLRV